MIAEGAGQRQAGRGVAAIGWNEAAAQSGEVQLGNAVPFDEACRVERGGRHVAVEPGHGPGRMVAFSGDLGEEGAGRQIDDMDRDAGLFGEGGGHLRAIIDRAVKHEARLLAWPQKSERATDDGNKEYRDRKKPRHDQSSRLSSGNLNRRDHIFMTFVTVAATELWS